MFFGKFGKDLTIDSYVVFFQPGDKTAVIGTVFAADRVDMDIPHCPRFPFFDFTVAVVVGKRFHHRLARRGQFRFSPPFEPFCIFNYVFSPFFMENASFNSGHENLNSESGIGNREF